MSPFWGSVNRREEKTRNLLFKLIRRRKNRIQGRERGGLKKRERNRQTADRVLYI